MKLRVRRFQNGQHLFKGFPLDPKNPFERRIVQTDGLVPFSFHSSIVAHILLANKSIVALFKEEVNHQKLLSEFKSKDFSKVTDTVKTIIDYILSREQSKVVSNFRSKPCASGLSSSIFEKLYSPDEQICYLVQSVNGCLGDKDIMEQVKAYGMSAAQIDEYISSVNSFIVQHSFLLERKTFASFVFRDYCHATLLVKRELEELSLRAVCNDLPHITSMFWEFYLNANNGKIKGEHVGILHSALSSCTFFSIGG